jgi:ankyrin repeat protein
MEQLLLSFGAEPEPPQPANDWSTSEYNWLRISPLHDAARRGDVRKAKALLKAGADLNARDEHNRSTPLAWAAKFGHLKMVKFLLKRGAAKRLSDDPDWATPLAWALKRGHAEIAKLLRD